MLQLQENDHSEQGILSSLVGKGSKRNSGLNRLLVVLGEFMDVYAAGGGLQGPSSVR